jgi:tRNA1Val (adenine37-N6)-methyltransferase
MAKGPFHFKSFSVEQDGAAMKVGTDGIVLGSWTPIRDARKILDAGAGNGYVGIMLLQRALPDSHLFGVELDEEAADQCTKNYRNQPFPHETTAWQGPIQKASKQIPNAAASFDLMVSNPPFFRNKPKSPNRARNLARHDDTMPMGELAKSAWDLLRPGGRLCTIWPSDREEEWNQWGLGMGFQCTQTTLVQTMRHLDPKRILTEWTKPSLDSRDSQACILRDQLTLEGSATLDFTSEYLEIVRPYLRGT